MTCSFLTKLIIILLLIQIINSSTTCQDPNYVIPVQPLDAAFDATLNTIRSPQSLIVYLADPTTQNFIDYTISLLPAAAPLWAMGVFTFVLFIACSIQLCCFDVCGRQGCGNKLTTQTYNIKPIKILMGVSITFSVFIAILCIIAIIVNSGLISAAALTNCNTVQISSQIYNGSSSKTTPWSGVSYFGQYISNTTLNLVNSQNALIAYFSSADYNNIVSTTSGSLYSNSQQFTCTQSSNSLTCPFSSTSLCPSPLKAVFNQQYCNSSFSGSTLNLITSQMSLNSTKWKDALVNLRNTIFGLDLTTSSISATVNQVSNFQTSINTYESSIIVASQGLTDAVFVTQIVLYIFYSFLLLASIIGIITLCATYFCGKFSCKVSACVFWIFYVLMGTLLFTASGFLLAATFISFDTCQAYNFYFSNQTNYNLIGDSINATNSNLNSILNGCFFKNQTSIFDSFSSTLKTQISTLQTNYANAIPASTFSSQVSVIENNLANWAAYPTTVIFVNQNSTNSASAALAMANTFVNFSAPNSGQSCNVTKDLFTFNPVNCSPYTTSNSPPNNTCVILSPPYVNTTSTSSTTQITNRVALFTNKGTTACNDQGTLYQNYANSLWNYGQSVKSIVSSYLAVPQSTTGNALHAYQSNYFNYYTSVSNFMSTPLKQQFASFLNPFSSLSQNSSCSFVTVSLNSLVSITCNQLFPYINIFTVINIVLSACVFIIMCTLYFLMPRLQFFAILEGNWDNWGQKSYKIQQLNKTEAINATELTDRNQNFLSSTNRQNA